MKISSNFHIEEFVPIKIFAKYGEKSKWFIRPEIIELAEFYRKWFGAPVRVNNWKWGGRFQERGYREPDSRTGSKYSQHKLGCAFDCDIRGYSADEVREDILKNQTKYMSAGLTTIEHAEYSPTWVHSDIRNTGMNKILIVKPATSVNFLPRDVCYTEDNGTMIQMKFH